MDPPFCSLGIDFASGCNPRRSRYTAENLHADALRSHSLCTVQLASMPTRPQSRWPHQHQTGGLLKLSPTILLAPIIQLRGVVAFQSARSVRWDLPANLRRHESLRQVARNGEAFRRRRRVVRRRSGGPVQLHVGVFLQQLGSELRQIGGHVFLPDVGVQLAAAVEDVHPIIERGAEVANRHERWPD